MSIKHAILGLLAEKPLHGYELKAAYEAELVPGERLNSGQVYTTLERLTRDGLVEHERVSQTERPDKKVYALTEAGRRDLDAWLAAPTALDPGPRDELLLKLILARRLPGGDALAVLARERRQAFAALHDTVRDRAEAVKTAAPLPTVLLLDLHVLRLEGLLKWLERCEERLLREATL